MSPHTTIYIGEFSLHVPDATAGVIDNLGLPDGHLNHETNLTRQYLRNIVRKRIQTTLQYPEHLAAFAASANTTIEEATTQLTTALADLTPANEEACYFHNNQLHKIPGTADKPGDTIVD